MSMDKFCICFAQDSGTLTGIRQYFSAIFTKAVAFLGFRFRSIDKKQVDLVYCSTYNWVSGSV